MLIKVIAELVIVFYIVLAVMGIPSQTITKTVKKPVKETHYLFERIPESLKNLNAKYHLKYHLSTYDIEQIDANFYAPKMIEYQEKTTIITQWINRFLIIAAYLVLIGFISAIISLPVAPPTLTIKLQCFFETSAPPIRTPRKPESSINFHE